MKNIIEELSLAVRTFLKERPSFSQNWIAQKARVSEGTIRNILKGRYLTQPTTIVNVCCIISGEYYPAKLPEKFKGELGQYLKEIIGDRNYRFVPNIESMLVDPDSFLV